MPVIDDPILDLQVVWRTRSAITQDFALIRKLFPRFAMESITGLFDRVRNQRRLGVGRHRRSSAAEIRRAIEAQGLWLDETEVDSW